MSRNSLTQRPCGIGLMLLREILLPSAAPVSAQPNAGAGVDSVIVEPVVRHEQLFGIGGVNVLDTYLSPVEYTGLSIGMLHRSERLARWGKGRVTVQATYAGAASLPRSTADRDKAMDARLSAAVAWLYRLRPLPVGMCWSIGGMAELETGFTYLMRGGNNPAQGRLATHFGLSVRMMQPIRVRNHRWEVCSQVDLPLVSARFTPNYGQSYYEIFSLGHYDRNVRVTTPFSAPSARWTTTLTLPVLGAHLSVGYEADIRQYEVNHLKRHSWNHQFLIGYVRRLRLLR